MATSGTATYTRTRNQIIEAAARKIRAIRAGQTMGPQMQADFAEALNIMVKHWQGRGLHVWTTTEATLFPQPGQTRYALAATGADHAAISYTATALAASGAAGDTALNVDAITGISANDHVGIVLDSGAIFWTTASGAPSGTTVTLADALTGAAAVDNAVYAYTAKIVRPLRIVDARRYNVASARDVPISPMLARLDYQALPNKTQQGRVTQAFYDPGLSTGYLSLWLTPSDVTELIKFTWWRPIEDFNAAGDNPDLPQEWMQTLIFNLAFAMAPEFSVGREDLEGPFGIGTLAAQYLDEVSGFDREAEPVMFGVDMTG